MFLRNFDMALV